MLFLFLSISLQINAQSLDNLKQKAQENGTEIIDIEMSILEKSHEINKEVLMLKSYSQDYKEGTYVFSLPQDDYNIHKYNLQILNNIYNNLLPELISYSKEYLQNYLGLSNDDIEMLDKLYLTNNKTPNFPLIHFSGSQVPENSNLKKIDTNIYGNKPVYKASYKDVLPTYMPNLENEILPVIALSSIELRLNYPDRFFTKEFPNLNIDIPNYEYKTSEITWKEIAFCAAVAIGADFLWGTAGLNGNQGNKWTKKAIIKAFGKIASRMLGPVGTVIAVGSFAGCLWEASSD